MTQPKMRIGYVTSSISSNGGWDTYARGLVTAMAKVADVVVLTRVDANNETIPGVKILKVLPRKDNSYRIGIQLRVAWQALKHLRGCTVIHSLIEPTAPGVALASRLLGAKFFLTFHGTYAIPPKGNTLKEIVKRNMMRFMYRTTAISTTGSDRNAKLIEEVMPIGEYRFIPNGVDQNIFYRMEVPAPRKPFLLTVGGVKARKGADVTIEALARVKDRFPDLEYVIVGETESSPNFIKRLHELMAQYGLQSRVHLLGRIDLDKVRELYNQCSVFVLAAQTRDGSFEGFPMVFYEAQACGAPLISTYGFGSEYVIKNGYNGFLVPGDTVEDLAIAIEKIVGNETLRQEMVQHALSEAQKNTWDEIGKQIMKMYTDGLRLHRV